MTKMNRPDPRYAKLAARSLGKELLWLLTCSHRQGTEPNILLFATRRGGSTFLMELIAANRGVRSIDQPFEMVAAFPTAAQVADMPLFEDGQLTSLDDRAARRLERLTQGIFEGRIVINAPTRMWRRDVSWRSNRLVLKILDAKPLIGWFADTVPSDIVYLTRHPIAQALSCMRNEWSLTAAAYLRDDRFVDEHLTNAAVDLAGGIMRSGSTLQQFVLNWALENVAPCRLLPDHPEWTHIRYEDCVTDPERILDIVASRLRLTDIDAMRASIARPSVSSGLSTAQTRQRIRAGRPSTDAAPWRDLVDEGTEAWCNRLLETFCIDPALVLPAP